MMARARSERALFLGIEGGATRTVALLANVQGEMVRRLEAGPANLRLLTDGQLTQHFRDVAAAFPGPGAVGIGLAGAWTEADRERILQAAASVWKGTPCYATNDLETALVAAGEADGTLKAAQVLIVSGTGSGCYGRNRERNTAKVGGWGHVLGDKGSGYDIGLRALRVVAEVYDRTGHWPRLGQRILGSLELNEPNDLIDWAQVACKSELSGLAPEVFGAWAEGDKLARGLVKDAAETLASAAVECARKLARMGNRVDFVLAGSVLLKQPRFAAWVARRLRGWWPGALVMPLRRESVWGAVELAKSKVQSPGPKVEHPTFNAQSPTMIQEGSNHTASEAGKVRTRRLSPTEERNPLSAKLHQMPLEKAIELMLREEGRVAERVLKERLQLERAIRAIVRAFRRGGRLFYVGAGTSGRLGVLDASECPPTFRTAPALVQGIIAGGQRALWRSVEGAEDDAGAGARAIQFRGVSARDVVVGIAASGTTPFVWGALGEAQRRRATTALVCFNPFLTIPKRVRPNIVIAPNLGPELLTGSTRLKAGTATKLILNLFTTLAMVRLGKVRSNLMIDLDPSNMKLRQRAVRIVTALTGAEEKAAYSTLERSAWVVKTAVSRLSRK